jgi:hypothetical protein
MRGHRTEELPVSRPKIRWEEHALAKSESA